MDTQRKVPFVAMWSEEQDNIDPIRMNFENLIEGPRDNRGVFWQGYKDAMGEGRPVFAQVHPIRQKMCMEGPYCQVCGKQLPKRNVPWLMPRNGDQPDDLIDRNARPFTTPTPPTCQDCWPVAEVQCPHLREHPFWHIIVKDYSLHGVYGDAFWRTGPLRTGQAGERGLLLVFGNPDFPHLRNQFVAKQLVVKINRWRVVS